MTAHRVRHQKFELGTLSVVVLIAWVALAVLGSALMSNWPDVFADAVLEQSAAPAQAAAVAAPAPYVSSDPSLPSASEVFSGGSYEPASKVDTF